MENNFEDEPVDYAPTPISLFEYGVGIVIGMLLLLVGKFKEV